MLGQVIDEHRHAHALLQVRPYQEDEVVLIVGSEHRFASRTHIDKHELLGLSFVSLHRSSTVQGIKNTLVGQGVDWRALNVVMVCQLSSAHQPCLASSAAYQCHHILS